MAFDLVMKADEDFLNPRRERVAQATLVRRQSDSNTFRLGSEPLEMTIDLAPEVPNPTAPKMPLEITNLPAAGAAGSDRAARAIANGDLISACHSQVSEFDLKMFSILARTVRASYCLSQPFYGCVGFAKRFKAFVFRGAEPLTYRMNILSYGVYCDDTCEFDESGIALLFRMTTDGAGRLAGGDVRVLDWCTEAGQIGCSHSENMAVFVMPPLRPDVEEQGPAVFERSAHLNTRSPELPQYNILFATINWPDLLKDTAWNEGSGSN